MVTPMIIGIMSDSHDNINNVIKAFNIFHDRNISYIIHLGDIISPFIARKMIELKWDKLFVNAVFGNNDGDKILLHKIFSSAGWKIDNGPRIEVIEGRKIFLMHGYNGIEFTKSLAYSIARQKIADIVLYGHTHKADKKIIDEVLVINPGETYGLLYGRATTAILDLDRSIVEFIEL